MTHHCNTWHVVSCTKSCHFIHCKQILQLLVSSLGRRGIVTVFTIMDVTGVKLKCVEKVVCKVLQFIPIFIQMFDYESCWITHQRLRRRLVEWVNTYLQYAITTKKMWGTESNRVVLWESVGGCLSITFLRYCGCWVVQQQGVPLPALPAVAIHHRFHRVAFEPDHRG